MRYLPHRLRNLFSVRMVRLCAHKLCDHIPNLRLHKGHVVRMLAPYSNNRTVAQDVGRLTPEHGPHMKPHLTETPEERYATAHHLMNTQPARCKPSKRIPETLPKRVTAR